MDITAIILNYRNYQDVCTCIESLESQDLPSDCRLNILVIDNHSGDGSTEKLQARFPEHRYIFNSENLGFAKGVNQGIDLTFPASDYFLLVNNDAELSADCLPQLLLAGQGAFLAGPAIFYKDEPKRIWQGGGFFSRAKMGLVVPEKNQPRRNKIPQIVDFLSGCVLLVSKETINIIGKFDEKFFFYGEDLDLCLRAKKAGLPVIYCPQASAWHHIKPIAKSRTGRFVLQNLAFSYLLIIKKHYPHLKYYGLLLFVFVYSPFRLLQIIAGRNDWRNIFYWLKGGWQGWKTKI